MADAMLPAELAAVTKPLNEDDQLLAADELALLSLFDELKKAPNFERFPGTTVLRRCRKGRVLVSQGEAGATAYTILTTEDVIEIRELQLSKVTKSLAVADDKELRKQQRDIEAELVTLRASRDAFAASKTPPNQRPAASAVLLLNDNKVAKKGLFNRFAGFFASSASSRKGSSMIPIDGPADMDSKTRRIALHESELFGEMSCMNRAPRSATVVADRDCYMLEMLRNVLDMLHKDEKYKQKLDDIYRSRVMDGHVRRLSIFQDISDADFAAMKGRMQLVEKAAGDVIFEEHEDSDSFYVVRSGLVKVVKHAWTFAQTSEFKPANWKLIWGELVEAAKEPAGSRVWSKLPSDLRTAAESADKTPPTAEQQTALVAAFNELIRNGDIHTQFGKSIEDVVVGVDSEQLAFEVEHYPEETEKWSELERRTFHRSLLELICPAGMPRRASSSGTRKTLRYLGRGDTFGELGVITGGPRSATILAYDHPDGGASQRLPDSRTGAVVSRVELVKIAKVDFLAIVNQTPKVKAKVDAIIAGFQKTAGAAGIASERTDGVTQSQEFEDLGLIQGQKLMLIDLERCTRCGQCVEACVAAHDDGKTRLYLDGPRFENYLVPLTCRSCMDPVCMIGCPVGAINRGDNGEILIRDWCIGCSMCADQCPYGSIQMNELPGTIELTESQKAMLGGADVKPVSERATVCDMCSSLSSKQPSCVYACPHDAAIRVNALEFFFTKG